MKRLPDIIHSVKTVVVPSAFLRSEDDVVEFEDYVQVHMDSVTRLTVEGASFNISALRYHFPRSLAALALDRRCAVTPWIVTRLNGTAHPMHNNVQASRILFRDTGYGNDVTLTFRPRSDMFSDDCWLVEQVPYEIRDAIGSKILLDTKAGKL